jgi:hypothetical protein
MVADDQYTHLDRNQPVLALIQNGFRLQLAGQNQLPDRRVIAHLHVVNQAENIHLLRQGYFDQVAKMRGTGLQNPAADGKTHSAGS